MNRFMYYLLFVNMTANMISAVPKILLNERLNGAIPSMLLSVIFGFIIVYSFVKFFNKFPEKGFPELLKEYAPSWFYYPFLTFIIAFWFVGGLITLITYSFMLKRYLTPDMSLLWIASSILIFVSFGILMNTKTVLNTVENILFITIPVIIYMMIKPFFSDQFEWDFVREAIMHTNHLPNYSAFSASSFVYVGVMNIIIFNRAFTQKKRRLTWKQLLLIGVTGISVLSAAYFIPIGLNGFNHIDHLVYPAITTSDTLRMKYGLIDRLLYLFMPFFLAISFLSMLIHWHVAIETCKDFIWFKRVQWKKMNLTPYLYLAVFWMITLKLITALSEYKLLLYSSYFFNAVPFQIIIFLLVCWFIKRRAKA